MSIALVIIHYGDLAHTRACLTSLAGKIQGEPVMVVNNTPDDLSSLKKIVPQLTLIENHANLGFAKAVNRGIREALQDPEVEAVLLVNNDALLEQGALSELKLALRKFPTAGILAPMLNHAGGYDWGGTYSPWWGKVAHRNWPNTPKTYIKVDHVAAAAMLIRRAVLEQVGYFDERFFLYYEDVDYCLRVRRAGYTIQLVPDVVFGHLGSASSGRPKRTLVEWQSHGKFVLKYLPRSVYPTGILVDLVLYPLYLLKSVLPV